MSSPRAPLRPRDFALLLLASGDLRPRQRARDQRADAAGLELKRRLLEELAADDPEPPEVQATLFRAVERFGPPFGPTRSMAVLIHEEWQAACLTPDWVGQLLIDAACDSAPEGAGRKRLAEKGSADGA